MTPATRQLITWLTDVLGPPVATPDLVRGPDGTLTRPSYRVHRWACPACRGGWDDPLYRPLVVDSEGRVFCGANHCSAERLATALRAHAAGESPVPGTGAFRGSERAA